MGKHLWIGRQRAAIGLTRAASFAEARLIHEGMAGRRSFEAATPPFMIPGEGPATEGEGAALRLPGRPPPPRRGEAGKQFPRKGPRT